MQLLPIDSHLQKIQDTFNQTGLVILMASPGSGKTTRVPAQILRSQQTQSSAKKIAVIVPKRVSALAAADRIADENNYQLGHEVGYQVRFEQKITTNTSLIFMTEGVFLRRLAHPDIWEEFDTVIIDEFHERSSMTDIILAFCTERKFVDDTFRLMVMSATLQINELTNYFQEFGLAPAVIQVEHAPHHLEILYSSKNQRLICDQTFYEDLKQTLQKASNSAEKDILVFLPGMKEMNQFKRLIEPIFTSYKIELLHGSINLDEQKRIIQPQNYKRIILSTNVAESSLTLSSVNCVIDSGLEKKIEFEDKMGFSRLNLQRISQFSATQRAGRAARVRDGSCYRQWHQIDERSMKVQTVPQILESDLIEETLLLAQLNIKDLLKFSWLQKPTPLQIKKAQQQLLRWNVITASGEITPLGQVIAQFPVQTRLAVLLFHLCQKGFVNTACLLISYLENQAYEKNLDADPSLHHSDIEKVLSGLQKSFVVDRSYQQLLSICRKNKWTTNVANESIADFEIALIQIFIQLFPERVCSRKTGLTGLSVSGRGVEIKPTSQISKMDYFIALSGREISKSTTLVDFAIGFDKKLALELMSVAAEDEITIEFDHESSVFYKTQTKKYGSLVLQQNTKQKLSTEEVKKHWAEHLKKNPDLFLNLNPHYENLKTKITFLIKKNDLLKMSELENFDFDEFQEKLIDSITSYYSDFDDYLVCDLFYISYQFLPEKISEALQLLPNDIKTPRGKFAKINYNDDKAPLISIKIQDAFGWTQTPSLFDGKIIFTLELLAPNMRPTQITNNLELFWGNSYLEIRKELKARYPKHDWPEKP